MEIIKILLSLFGGVLILSYGANLFVDAASKMARNLGISPLVIGLTIVSCGTSAPELAVSALASIEGNVDIAVGNIVGSNIFNIAGIIGMCALVSPLLISQQLLKIDIPIMLGAAALCWFFGRDGHLAFWECLIFFVAFIGYTVLQIKLSRQEKKDIQEEYAEAFGKRGPVSTEVVKLFIGLVLLVVGARFFVNGAVDGARLLGWSEAVIALTIIAIGTSLPEVATSVTATLKGERDIAVGNVVGSNIFNVLGILGFSGLLAKGGLNVNPQIEAIDMPVMVILSTTCLPMAIFRQRFDRWMGIFYLLAYGVYTWHLLSRV